MELKILFVSCVADDKIIPFLQQLKKKADSVFFALPVQLAV